MWHQLERPSVQPMPWKWRAMANPWLYVRQAAMGYLDNVYPPFEAGCLREPGLLLIYRHNIVCFPPCSSSPLEPYSACGSLASLIAEHCPTLLRSLGIYEMIILARIVHRRWASCASDEPHPCG